MKIPGFSAEASLASSVGVYEGARMRGIALVAKTGVVPQTWKGGCFSPGRTSQGRMWICGAEDEGTLTSHYFVLWE